MSNRPEPSFQSSPFAPLILGGAAFVAALLVQFGFARSGRSALVPPYSGTIALVTVGIVLLVFGLRLKRTIADEKRAVDPFHAVRVLVSARAGALVGGMFAGFGAGLACSLLGRTVAAAPAIWLPMVAMSAAGLFLAIVGVITERWCRVPPGDDGTSMRDDGDTDPETQTAYRRP